MPKLQAKLLLFSKNECLNIDLKYNQRIEQCHFHAKKETAKIAVGLVTAVPAAVLFSSYLDKERGADPAGVGGRHHRRRDRRDPWLLRRRRRPRYRRHP